MHIPSFKVPDSKRAFPLWLRDRMSLAGQFMLLSLIILVAGAVVIGNVVGVTIEQGVINRTMAVTALYVDSFVRQHVQEVATGPGKLEVRFERLDALLIETALGQKIVSFKIWSTDGQILYAKDKRLIGRRFPIGRGLRTAIGGDVASHVSTLPGQENLFEREQWTRLIETYSPILHLGDGRVIGVAEFYQEPHLLDAEIARAKQRGWGVVSAATLFMFLALNGTMRRASNTIVRQNRELHNTVHELTSLHAIVDASIASSSVTHSLELLLQRLVTSISADAGLVLLGTNGDLQPRAIYGTTAPRAAEVARLLEVWVPDLPPDSGVQSWNHECADDSVQRAILNSMGVRSLLVAPLAARGELLGVLLVGSAATVPQSPIATRLVLAVSERAGLFLSIATLVERLQGAAVQKFQTDERLLTRIAHELHDGPAQDVSLALLRIEALYKGLRPGDETEAPQRDFQMIRSALESALREIRQISAGLRLPELMELGPGQVARKACEDHETLTGSPVHLHLYPVSAAASMPVKIAVYRIIQEALRNAFRHGNAAEIAVQMTEGQGTLRVIVTDDGTGFNPGEAVTGTRGFRLGLRGMQERAELLGGTLTIRSAPGRGTVLSAEIPVGAREEAERYGPDSHPGGR